MALGQAVVMQSLRHRLLQPQQTQLVGHGGLAAAQLFRRLLLAEAVAAEQAGDGGRLLHVVQVPALEVLDQGQQGGVLLIHPGQQTGHLPQPGDPRRPPAALAGHQLVDCALLPDGERLQNAVGGDAGRQLLQTLRVEPAAGLLGVGTDIVDGYVSHAGREEISLLVFFHGSRLLFFAYCTAGGLSKAGEDRREIKKCTRPCRDGCGGHCFVRISSPKKGRIW